MMQFELLGLYAETSIHAGAGSSTGVIDLPIMREAHTGWPCIFGSAVKGALRCKAEQGALDKDSIADVFGPDTNNASDHAGALAVGDARLLLLPVRSLTSHFKWVTCPALLNRAADDARRMNKNVPAIKLPDQKNEIALHAADSAPLYLEEFQFQAQKHDLGTLINWLAGFVNTDENFAERLQKQLVIVSDDMFAHLAQYATPVNPHIAINNQSKTVKSGALWYEETLPPETVLYIALAASPARSQRREQVSAASVLGKALQLFPLEAPYLQLGGNETVGMGWCRVSKVGA
ncbi:type III-B CRISPR module RAMP protein Cmr4 [Chitinilyticum piscinae]|uniref:Type III-B CRISPR module RAMP protein Cmr4 n=1 Tax=Chitinilyticum piscinae TaxID=2866724 RepID=A0A8J7FK06_9NEIS|nr:type III-B CRISPR module RAMP protein Cmr4 [Chitinilyticum piscinae]MBE9610825.1 type III-B CRISPR module RAMP protein Cmr4 [Chitinilyticum piscinae]